MATTKRKQRQTPGDKLPPIIINSDDNHASSSVGLDLSKLSEESIVLLSVLTERLNEAVKDIVNGAQEREKICYLGAELHKIKQENALLRRRLDEVETLQRSDSIILSGCLLYTSPSPRDKRQSRMPSSA